MSEVQFDKTPVTKSVIDLNDFSKVTLGKLVADTWSRISNTSEALAAVGNDSAKFLNIIKEGLRAEARRVATQDDAGFKVLNEDKSLGSEFSGAMGHPKVVNAMVGTLAKTFIEGDWASATKEAKLDARNSAKDTIKSVPKMLESMKRKSAEMFESADPTDPDDNGDEA